MEKLKMNNPIIATSYTFTNHHNGAQRSKYVGDIPHREPDEIHEYCSQDNFRRSEFGNGLTVKKVWREMPTEQKSLLSEHALDTIRNIQLDFSAED